MKTSKFTYSQIMAILKHNEAGIKVPDLCCEHGINDAIFYKWRAKYGGMDAAMIKRLKGFEDENLLLKSQIRQEALEGKW